MKQRKEGGVLLRNYRIFETNRFMTDLKLLARAGLLELEDKLRDYVYPQLKEEPHFGLNIKKLRNWKPQTWRYRVGAWRFFYIIDEGTKVVSMAAASRRKDAYR